MSLNRRRKKRGTPYVSGYCLFAARCKDPANRAARPICRGEVTNGVLVKPRITLCSCTCHGDYSARLTAYGLDEPILEPDDEDDVEED